jgi:hypothetical protein
MEAKILSKPKLPPRVARSSGNMLNDITQFSQSFSRAEPGRDSFMKKKLPCGYKSSKKRAKGALGNSSKKKSIVSTQQSIRSKRTKRHVDPFESSGEEVQDNIYKEIQRVLMNSHEDFRGFAHDIREKKDGQLKRIYIGRLIRCFIFF